MHVDLKEALTRKIGPLPGGAWAGIAVLGIVAYVHFHKGSTSSTSSTTTDPGTTALQTGGGLLGGGGGAGGGTGGGVVGSDTIGSSAGTFTDPNPGDSTPVLDPVFMPVPDSSTTVFPDPSPTSTPNDKEPVAVLTPTQTLYTSSGGVNLGTVQAPILPFGTPAADLYRSVGLDPSSPITLTPGPLPPPSPQDANQQISVALNTETGQRTVAQGMQAPRPGVVVMS